MDLPPLPPCPQAIDRSLPDADWNRHNKHWLSATVWIAQHTAHQASSGCVDSTEGLQRCAGCAADLTLREKPKCSKCKLVYFCNTDCQRKAHSVHKHACRPVNRAVPIRGEIEDCVRRKQDLWSVEHMEHHLSTPTMNTAGKLCSAYQAFQYGDKWTEQGCEKALKAYERALELGRELGAWHIQSTAYAGLITSCKPHKGTDLQTSLKYWDEALTEARSHKDLYLEALAIKSLGLESSALGIDVAKECYLTWLALMKACRAKGPVATSMLHECCGNTQVALTLIAESMNHKDKAVTAEAEILLREALLYAEMVPNEPVWWPLRWMQLSSLANVCQLCDFAMEPEGQMWRQKAATYRQHALRHAKRMGRDVSSTCSYCNEALEADRPADSIRTFVVVNTCGHMQHALCQAKAKQQGALVCPICHKRLLY